MRTFETYTRNTLDLSAIPAIRQMSHLPIIVDPSHAAGMYWMVEPLALAATAIGADGLIIEVHNDPPPRQVRRTAVPDSGALRQPHEESKQPAGLADGAGHLTGGKGEEA